MNSAFLCGKRANVDARDFILDRIHSAGIPMSFRDTLKAKIGEERYEHIDAEAQKEFALASAMLLKDKFATDQYYSPRPLLKEFASEAEYFEKVGLKILPAEVVHVVFKCKLLLAAKSEQEFNQRSGHVSLFASRAIFPSWADKGMKFDQLEDKYVSGLETDIRERTLLSHISSLNPDELKPGSQQPFFEDLFSSLGMPFVSFLDEDLVKNQKAHTIRIGVKVLRLCSSKAIFLCTVPRIHG